MCNGPKGAETIPTNNPFERLVFVVQKHKAKTMHYDFRLEVDGVMPSWAIPKGPSLDSSVKRLAMPTGDHPIEYRHFEGVIGEDQYGAGPVMVWDEGTYTPEREVSKGIWQEITNRNEAEIAMREGLRAGNVNFQLYGKKLQGSFALVRIRSSGKQESWLLIKHHDEYVQPGYDANDHDFSAVSSRTLAEIAVQEA
jgi:bifunctional non-homologous end joining protein LigD